MRLSTKGRYAVTAMMDLAIHESKGPVTLADISDCQDISLSYLEQLFSKLRRKNLVRGVRGPGGGYQLARPATEITIAAIIADEMAIGMINAKTTATRIIPVPGKKAGDNVNFGGLLGKASIMDVPHLDLEDIFVEYGGHIPAPIHSLKN